MPKLQPSPPPTTPIPTELKNGWTTKTLGEVCEFKPPKREAKDRLKDNDLVSFVPMEDLGILTKDFLPTKERKLKDVAGSYTYFGENDVLLAKITPCFENGKIGIAHNLKNGVGFGSSEYFVFRPKEELLSDYLYFFLSRDEFRLHAASLMTGAVGHKRVPKELVEGLQIPLPPLPEQHRIVAILDDVFARVAAAKATAEKNLANARELFESYLQRVFAEPGEGGEMKSFEDIVADNVVGLTKHSREQGVNRKFPYLKMNNITRHNRLDLSKMTRVDATKEELAKFSLRDGDFLFNTRNSRELVGKTCVFYGEEDARYVFNNNIVRIRFHAGMNPRYVNYAFCSPPVIMKLESLKSGTTNVWAIYQKDLRKLMLPVPSSAIARRNS